MAGHHLYARRTGEQRGKGPPTPEFANQDGASVHKLNSSAVGELVELAVGAALIRERHGAAVVACSL